MKLYRRMVVALAALAVPLNAQAPQLRPDQAAFRALYQELVEIDTSITSGSCTAAADRIEARLKAAGYGERDITRFSVPEFPKEGGIVVVLPGSSAAVKPMLLLGHIDVVTARREDWARDPYRLVEENGYFYGRGAQDMKAMVAIWVDAMIRFKQGGYKPRRTIKLALTCGEETSTAFNGARWLAENRRELIDAEFALNEGGGGRSDGKGRIVIANMHVGEKTPVNYRIEATNAGGHSSAPVPDNAIYDLADALAKIRGHSLPLQFTDTTRAYFRVAGKARGDAMGAAMMALAANPADRQAESLVNSDRAYHSMLRTTCVATLLDGGHANNALPQRAGANINCRIFPGGSAEDVRRTLETVIANPKMTVVRTDDRGPIAVPPPLDPKIIGPAEKLLAKYYPGVPLAPTMSTGATDGIFLASVGIPVYGPPGLYSDPDGNGTHGLNERAIVKAVYSGRDYLFELIKAYAD